MSNDYYKADFTHDDIRKELAEETDGEYVNPDASVRPRTKLDDAVDALEEDDRYVTLVTVHIAATGKMDALTANRVAQLQSALNAWQRRDGWGGLALVRDKTREELEQAAVDATFNKRYNEGQKVWRKAKDAEKVAEANKQANLL